MEFVIVMLDGTSRMVDFVNACKNIESVFSRPLVAFAISARKEKWSYFFFLLRGVGTCYFFEL